MNFELTISEGSGSPERRVHLVVGKPVLNAGRSRWECVARWDGAASGSLCIHGATSFQSLSLALTAVEQEIACLFPGSHVRESGAPWLLREPPPA